MYQGVESRFTQIASPLKWIGSYNYATQAVAGSVVIYEKVAPLSNSVVPDSPPPSEYEFQRLHDFVNARYLSLLCRLESVTAYH